MSAAKQVDSRQSAGYNRERHLGQDGKFGPGAVGDDRDDQRAHFLEQLAAPVQAPGGAITRVRWTHYDHHVLPHHNLLPDPCHAMPQNLSARHTFAAPTYVLYQALGAEAQCKQKCHLLLTGPQIEEEK